MRAFISVIIMALVTYIPRAVPLLLVRKEIENVYVKSFLYYMPYAVLAALTFPAIFTSVGSITAAVIGTVAAIIISYFELGLFAAAVAAVVFAYFTGMIL